MLLAAVGLSASLVVAAGGSYALAATTPNIVRTHLAPVRDLQGVWFSALRGRGLEVSGRFSVGPAVGQFTETGDITLKVNAVSGGALIGTIQYTGLVVSGSIMIPSVDGSPSMSVPISRTPEGNTGAMPIRIAVSGSRLVFPTIHASGITFTMSGSYTTDIMTGSMTANLALPGYESFRFAGVLTGSFRLMRQ
jgi:hypothetical protein